MKKIISLLLAITIVFSTAIVAFADVTATLELDNGETFSVPVNYEIVALPTLYSKEGARQRFAVTARAAGADSIYGSETTSDSRIQVTAYATMYFSRLSTGNYIDGCEGGWYTESGSSVTGSRLVKLQFFPSGPNVSKRPTSNSYFYENINLKSSRSPSPSAVIEAKVKGTEGATATLKLLL